VQNPREKNYEEASFVSAVIDIPEAHDPQRNHDYKLFAEAYKNYWATCTDAYVFKID
jgi:hypothetical protein